MQLCDAGADKKSRRPVAVKIQPAAFPLHLSPLTGNQIPSQKAIIVKMWSGLSNWLAHILPLISPTSHQHAYPGSNRLLNEALATQAVLGGVVEVNGAATITPGPKFPSLAKRQGTSFIGYIASGASCMLYQYRTWQDL